MEVEKGVGVVGMVVEAEPDELKTVVGPIQIGILDKHKVGCNLGPLTSL